MSNSNRTVGRWLNDVDQDNAVSGYAGSYVDNDYDRLDDDLLDRETVAGGWRYPTLPQSRTRGGAVHSLPRVENVSPVRHDQIVQTDESFTYTDGVPTVIEQGPFSIVSYVEYDHCVNASSKCPYYYGLDFNIDTVKRGAVVVVTGRVQINHNYGTVIVDGGYAQTWHNTGTVYAARLSNIVLCDNGGTFIRNTGSFIKRQISCSHW